MPHQKKLPELYAYIFRNIILSSCGSNVATSDNIFKSIKKVTYKIPKPVLRNILYELIYDYCVLKEISEGRFLIYLNKKTQRQLGKLKEHVFPIDF